MKKILGGVLAISLLSGCQLIDQIQSGQSQQVPSKVEITPEQAALFQKLDEQFLRVKGAGQEITFNGETYVKQTQAVKGDYPRFLSLAASVDRENRKAVLSDTFYLNDASMEPTLTAKYLEKNKSTCDLKTLSSDAQTYYACESSKFQRFVALVHKSKNIVSYRSFTAYQQKLTPEQEKAVVKALVDYPFDAISR